jgi:hypothetical protein
MLIAVAIPARADIFRCKAGGGTVTYQEIPCPDAASGGATGIPDAYPEINHAERNRLLQREAALDSRMLKRAEIDSAERIARSELAVREREAQAMRDAAAQREASTIPGFIVGPAFGYRPHPRPVHRWPLRGA